MNTEKTFGTILVELKETLGWSWRYMAKKTGYAFSSLNEWGHDKHKPHPTIQKDVIKKLNRYIHRANK